MKEKDLKLLWGRAAHRCSICGLELTIAGSTETIGETAHIVARSKDGPRGHSSLTREERDSYPNLMLLCGNHHTEIDKAPDLWPTSKLHNIKTTHESWISDQLSKGSLSIPTLDNSEYLTTRSESWRNQYNSNTILALSLTPLEIIEDLLDPVNKEAAALLTDVPIIGPNYDTRTRSDYVRPDAEGLRVTSDENVADGWRFHLLITRSGHCEIVFELEADKKETGIRVGEQAQFGDASKSLFRYTLLHAALYKGIGWISSVYSTLLPFNEMKLSCLFNEVRGSNLLTAPNNSILLGNEIQSDNVSFSTILSRDENHDDVLHPVLSRLCQAYGMVLPDELGSKDKPATPTRFSMYQ